MKTLRTRIAGVLVEFTEIGTYVGEVDIEDVELVRALSVWEAEFMPDVDVMDRPFDLRCAYAGAGGIEYILEGMYHDVASFAAYELAARQVVDAIIADIIAIQPE